MTNLRSRCSFALRKNLLLKTTAVVALSVGLLSTATAGAEPVSGALLVGYGFDEGYKLGLGVRGGFTAPFGLYLGGTLILHEGATGIRIERDERPQTDLYYGGAEGGWDFSAGPLVFRPYLGLGYGLARASTLPDCAPAPACAPVWSNDGALALFPGAMGLVSSGGIFVGADVRYVLLIGSAYRNAFSAFGTAGLAF